MVGDFFMHLLISGPEVLFRFAMVADSIMVDTEGRKHYGVGLMILSFTKFC